MSETIFCETGWKNWKQCKNGETSVCRCITEKLDHDKDFKKEDVRACIEQAVKQVGFKVEFRWEIG